MCLLVIQNKTAPMLSDDWLRDFYSSNPDGIGVMYSQNNQLIIEKTLPKSANDFIKFYKDHVFGRDCAFHLRMKTHGNIDLENCHPYEVLNQREHGIDLWLMHNGILHTDNKKDATKSDTWHYIRDYLIPILQNNPEFAFHDSFVELISEHIGTGNKFVLMDNRGRMSVINKDSGVYWAGLWLSNTYAWSASANAGKHPINDPNKQYEQSMEKPVKYTRPLYSSSYYGYGYESEFDDYGQIYSKDSDDQLCDDIDQVYIELENADKMTASQIPFQMMYDFCLDFGYDALFDLAFMCIENTISEDWFVRAVSDTHSVQDQFPFLKRKKVANYD